MVAKKRQSKRPSVEITPTSVPEHHSRYPKRYIFTGAQASYYESTEKDKEGNENTVLKPWLDEGSAPLHENLYAGLKRFAKEKDAELQILPMAGKCQREDVLHESVRDLPEVEENWADNYKKLNDNVTRSDIRVPPQNVDPSTGRTSLPNRYQATLIYPHSKQRLAPVGTFQTWTRFLATTGCITTPHYNWRNDRGNQAVRDHVMGALFVEVLSPTQYNMRHLTATPNGQFVDLAEKFDGDSKPKRVGVEALVPGDIHLGAHKRELLEATYGQIDYFKPKKLVLHDFFNGHSICHHEMEDWVERARQFKFTPSNLCLEEELENCYLELHRFANAIGKKNMVYLPHSNHDDFLKKYIQDDIWKRDPWNVAIVAKIIGSLPDKDSYLKNAIGLYGKLPENVRFLKLKDKLNVLGNNLSIHGHIGRNGSRGGSAKQKAAHFGKGIYGHTHAPEISGDVHVTGTLAPDQAYTEGSSSSAMAASDVLYENGKKQMLLMPTGRWR